MKSVIKFTCLALFAHNAFAQSADPEAIPGGDQFATGCSVLIPGGDQFATGRRNFDDELPEEIPGGDQFGPQSIPGGDQFDSAAIPGGDQFDPQAIPGGDQFVKKCFEQFRLQGLLIPGGDQFDPRALERLANGELKIDDELPEGIPGGDQFDATQIANGGGLGFQSREQLEADLANAGLTSKAANAIPRGDQFDPSQVENNDLLALTREASDAEASDDGDALMGDTPPESIPGGDQFACNWTGTWSSTYGILRLVQNGREVSGDYGTRGFINGTVGASCGLQGTFDNRLEGIQGTFEFVREDERFQGLWGRDGEAPNEAWKGRRSTKEPPKLYAEERWGAACRWTGTWFTPTTGVRMRLIQEGERVYGELGDRESIEGRTEIECVGNREVRMQATLTDRDTGSRRSMTLTLTSGGQRYLGSIGQAGEGLPSAGVFAGSRAAAGIPTLLEQPSEDDSIQAARRLDDGTMSDDMEEEQQQVERKSAVGRWAVNLGAVCSKSNARDKKPLSLGLEASIVPIEGYTPIQGIVWVKARVYNKRTRQEVEIAPVSGFPNVNGDKERAWELRMGQSHVFAGREGGAVQTNGCGMFVDRGFLLDPNLHVPSQEIRDQSATLIFEIDPERFGYRDMEELLDRRRNRIRVMYKLETHDIYVNFYELPTKMRSHAIADANFCGTCKIDEFARDENGDLTVHPLDTPRGDGVFSGFRKNGADVFVLYDIKRLPDNVD